MNERTRTIKDWQKKWAVVFSYVYDDRLIRYRPNMPMAGVVFVVCVGFTSHLTVADVSVNCFACIL